MSDKPRRAYLISVYGRVVRDIIVWGDTAEDAKCRLADLDSGQDEDFLALGDRYEETHQSRPKRLPSEDRG